jgi:hypothetical protein
LTFEFKPFKNPETKIRRKDIKRGMVALLVTPVKKIILSKENHKFNKQRHPTLSIANPYKLKTEVHT